MGELWYNGYMMKPRIKMLMKLPKDILIYRAKEMGISFFGSKLSIAQRISDAEENDFERSWRAIVDRQMKH